MSNFDKKQAQELGIAFAREVAELTGETSSKLYQWGLNVGLPVPKARQTFYSHIDRRNWKRSVEPSSTERCRMDSYPMCCQLRLRVVSLKAQFRQDKRRGDLRQLIVLLGYEMCSGLLHFRLYRGPEDSDGGKDMEVCNLIPVATLAEFVQECGQMVGLPLKQVLFTQKIVDFVPRDGALAYLSLTSRKLIQRGHEDEAGVNEVLCSYCLNHPKQKNGMPQQSLLPYTTFGKEHSFSVWCEDTNAEELAWYLSGLVKQHNKVVALPRLESARSILESRWSESLAAAKVRHGPSRFAMRLPPFLLWMKKQEYALKEVSADALRFHKTLHEVRFHKRPFEKYFAYPGDRGRLAMKGKLGDTAT